MDDKTKTGAQDRARVAKLQDYEVEHLMRKWRVTRKTVLDAITRVGNSRDKVEAELVRLTSEPPEAA